MPETNNRLLVIGAGPKAAALAARAKILRDMGRSSTQVVIIEQNDSCANWSGQFGYTDGQQQLGTPPEKDVGFPYTSGNREVNARLFAEYSWPVYQVSQTQRYGEWVDRGRPQPRHADWGLYCEWVIRKSGATIIRGKATKIGLANGGWRVTVKAPDDAPATHYGKGLVITGPGPAKATGFPVAKHKHVLRGDEFWVKKEKIFKSVRSASIDAPPIAVVGGGETAASIVCELIDLFWYRHASIVVLTRAGTIFSRGEGYFENKVFTESAVWPSLPSAKRREVINRGDRGVFSVEAVKKISHATNVTHRFFTVQSVEKSQDSAETIELKGLAGGQPAIFPCQLLVLANGFEPLWWLSLLEGADLKQAINPRGTTYEAAFDRLESSIAEDMSLGIDGLDAKLYLPMLAAVEQGPGFPNLSCLGTLSDRIFRSAI